MLLAHGIYRHLHVLSTMTRSLVSVTASYGCDINYLREAVGDY